MKDFIWNVLKGLIVIMALYSIARIVAPYKPYVPPLPDFMEEVSK